VQILSKLDKHDRDSKSGQIAPGPLLRKKSPEQTTHAPEGQSHAKVKEGPESQTYEVPKAMRSLAAAAPGKTTKSDTTGRGERSNQEAEKG
jgi:hypothetical protein